MRIERIILEHHGDIAFLGAQVIYHTRTNGDFTIADFLKSCDHAQERGFSAARRANQNDKFAVFDINRHAMQNADIAIFLDCISDGYRCHLEPQLLFDGACGQTCNDLALCEYG